MTADGSLVRLIRRARILDVDRLVDIELSDGTITDVRPSTAPGGGGSGSSPGVLDADGYTVLPAFVDAHVHLDKVFHLDDLHERGLPVGTLADALTSTGLVRKALDDEAVMARARRAVDGLVTGGCGSARVHVEIDGAGSLADVLAHVKLADDVADEIDLQLCAFPQHGWTQHDGMDDAMEAAIAGGCQVVGGCPYTDPDPEGHIERVFTLARHHDLDVDFHIDFTDDPDAHGIDAILDATTRHGWGGRVVVGHLTSLAAQLPRDAEPRIRRLADEGVAVVSLPATDLYLGGRMVDHNRPRGITPLRELLRAGVAAAVASNNHQNAFTPYGGGGLLPLAWLAGLAGHFGTAAEQRSLLDLVTVHPATMLGRGPAVVEAGAPADLAIVNTEDPLDAVRRPGTVTHVLHRQRLIRAGAARPGAEHPESTT